MWQAACANEEEYNERDYWTDIFGENVTDSLKVWAEKKACLRPPVYTDLWDKNLSKNLVFQLGCPLVS